jgi:hypothetical protein
MNKNPRIFVFGSNLAGRHGKGAALAAVREHGAEYGVGEGRTGNAYAVPTKDGRLKTRTLNSIKASVDAFLVYASGHPDLTFQVTALGTGLAGYRHAQIAPMFKEAPINCDLPAEWHRFYGGDAPLEKGELIEVLIRPVDGPKPGLTSMLGRFEEASIGYLIIHTAKSETPDGEEHTCGIRRVRIEHISRVQRFVPSPHRALYPPEIQEQARKPSPARNT